MTRFLSFRFAVRTTRPYKNIYEQTYAQRDSLFERMFKYTHANTHTHTRARVRSYNCIYI